MDKNVVHVKHIVKASKKEKNEKFTSKKHFFIEGVLPLDLDQILRMIRNDFEGQKVN